MHTWPPASANIGADAKTTITIAGVKRILPAASIDAGREQARKLLSAWASHLGRPLTARVTDPQGTWIITITSDTDIRELTTQKHRRWWNK